MTFWASALSLTLRTEKTTFCPGSRPWRFITSDRMKGTLEPSAPSITPTPCASIFLTIPIILSVLRVQDRSLQHLPWPPVEQETSLFHCSFPRAGPSLSKDCLSRLLATLSLGPRFYPWVGLTSME